MDLQTFACDGEDRCDMCYGGIADGETVALIGQDLICENCVQQHRELEAA